MQQARQLIESENKEQVAKQSKVPPAPAPARRESLRRQTSKEKISLDRILPLSQINKSKREQKHIMANKTPSMIDLAPEQIAVKSSHAEQQPLNVLPIALTFDDIQKMQYH